MNARRTLVGLVSLTTAVMLMGAPSALAKPGGSSGSHSSSGGSHSGSSGSGSHSGSSGSGSKSGSSGSGSGSGSGRNVQAPVNSNKSTTKNNTTNNSNTGSTRKVQAPVNSNKTTVPGLKGVKNPPTTTYSVPKSTQAKGKTYTVPGTHTSYTYNRTVYSGYYSTYHGGYPTLGTALYFSLLNDPFYYPNYTYFGSPWYGHAYPSGYLVSDNQLVPVAHKSHALLIFSIIGALILIAFAAWLLTSVIRRRKESEEERPFANQF